MNSKQPTYRDAIEVALGIIFVALAIYFIVL